MQQARDLGDFLILGLNSDASTTRLKGAGRPLTSEGERAEILAALMCIDYVTIFGEATASTLVDLLQPALYVKGGDYSTASDDNVQFDPRRLPEGEHVLAYGGTVRLIPYLPHHSTTEMIEKIKRL